MELKVYDKFLDVGPVTSVLRQGESYSDRVTIAIPRWYAGLDRAGLSWSVIATSEYETLALYSAPSVWDETTITLTWEVTDAFTARGAYINLELDGVYTNGKILSRIIGNHPVWVEPDPVRAYKNPPSVGAQSLQQLMEIANRALQSEKNAAGSAAAAETSNKNAAGQAELAKKQVELAKKEKEEAKAQADRAEAAILKGPKINDASGHWEVYSHERNQYADTGVKAAGNVMFAVFTVDPITGRLCMRYNNEYRGPDFRLADSQHLEVYFNA